MTPFPRRSAALIAVAATAVSMGLGLPSSVGAQRPSRGGLSTPASSIDGGSTARERVGFYDARQPGPHAAAVTRVRAQSPGANLTRLRRLAGVSTLAAIDPVTGTPDNFGSLDGFLTRASSAAPRRIALTYVRNHAGALGLTRADLATFRLRRDYVDVAGTHHLSWTQAVRGIPVFGNGLRAHVTRNGRLVALQGAPVSGLANLTAGSSARPGLSAAESRGTAARDVGGKAQPATARQNTRATTSVWSNGDRSRLVWFVAASGAHLAWSTYTQAGGSLSYSHVIDAASGRVLYRSDLVDFERGDAKVYDYYPGAAKGGTARVVNLFKRGWLSRQAPWLNGRNVSAWADVNDDNIVNPNEKTPVPGTPHGAQFTLTRFGGNALCSPQFQCTWNPNAPFSWRTNKAADTTNAFYLANAFHDYLAQRPIGFTPAAGNFERADGDPVLLNALDGANTSGGLPDGNHIDNANMNTPPDGNPPVMQMFLWHFPHTPNAIEPWLPTSGAFDASILFHEYTHGLSNRLVVDAAGNGALNSIQPGSMGEAWSDYYAMDYLVTKGFQNDTTATDGQVRVAKYVLANKFLFRTEAMDCDPNSTVNACRDLNGVRGGYTYGDFPTIGGSPEVHASGEVWSQTLWDLRERFGHQLADTLITRGMELSPDEPTMLDMRNAIIQADKIVNRSANTNALWAVFAARGMGWFAGAIDGGDSQPAEDFHRPPSPQRPSGPLVGLVTDPVTGDPVPGATVTVTGHPEYSDATDATGAYRIGNVRPGLYPKVIALANGFEIVVKSVRAAASAAGTRLDFAIRRDWAASNGGAAITAFNGPDFSDFGCGPGGAIDLSQGIGWGSTTGDDLGTPTGTAIPKFVQIALPEPIDIVAGTDPVSGTAFRVDPTAICGDPLSSSTNDFRIEVSTDGVTFTQVVDSAFGTIADPDTNGHYFDVPAAVGATNVQFVKFWIDSPQVPDFATNCPAGAFGGCTFTDMTELEVFGTLTGP